MKVIRIVTIGLAAALVILSGFLGWKFYHAQLKPLEEVQKMEVTRSKIVATRDLQEFTLLKDGYLGGNTSEKPDVSKFNDRYLLISVKQGDEVRDENVAAAGATEVLNDAIAVTVASSAATSLAGQLRVGQVVELLAIPAGKEAVKLVVLNPNTAGAIMLAVSTKQRDQFSAAIGATQVVITRKIDVHK